jgi:hypothetical protein
MDRSGLTPKRRGATGSKTFWPLETLGSNLAPSSNTARRRCEIEHVRRPPDSGAPSRPSGFKHQDLDSSIVLVAALLAYQQAYYLRLRISLMALGQKLGSQASRHSWGGNRIESRLPVDQAGQVRSRSGAPREPHLVQTERRVTSRSTPLRTICRYTAHHPRN